MLKILVDLWDKNKDVLKQELKGLYNVGQLDYKTLVKMTFEKIYNVENNIDEYPYMTLDCESVTEIDNGDYQGTLLYLIPFDRYQPSEFEYLMTYVDYGSCSGCDTLLSIIDWGDARPTDTQVNELLALCKDILTNTIKPYNSAWRKIDLFDSVEIDD